MLGKISQYYRKVKYGNQITDEVVKGLKDPSADTVKPVEQSFWGKRGGFKIIEPIGAALQDSNAIMRVANIHFGAGYALQRAVDAAAPGSHLSDSQARDLYGAMERLKKIEVSYEDGKYSLKGLGEAYEDINASRAIADDLGQIVATLAKGDRIDDHAQIFKDQELQEIIAGLSILPASKMAIFGLQKSTIEYSRTVFNKMFRHKANEAGLDNGVKGLVSSYLQNVQGATGIKRALAVVKFLKNVGFELNGKVDFQQSLNEYIREEVQTKLDSRWGDTLGEVTGKFLRHEITEFLENPLSPEYLGNKKVDFNDTRNLDAKQYLKTLGDIWTSGIPKDAEYRNNPIIKNCIKILKNPPESTARNEAAKAVNQMMRDKRDKYIELKDEVEVLDNEIKLLTVAMTKGDDMTSIPTNIRLDIASDDQIEEFIKASGLNREFEAFLAKTSDPVNALSDFIRSDGVGVGCIEATPTEENITRIEAERSIKKEKRNKHVLDSASIRATINRANLVIPGIGRGLMDVLRFKSGEDGNQVDFVSFLQDKPGGDGKLGPFFKPSVEKIIKRKKKEERRSIDKNKAKLFRMKGEHEVRNQKFQADFADAFKGLSNDDVRVLLKRVSKKENVNAGLDNSDDIKDTDRLLADGRRDIIFGRLAKEITHKTGFNKNPAEVIKGHIDAISDSENLTEEFANEHDSTILSDSIKKIFETGAQSTIEEFIQFDKDIENIPILESVVAKEEQKLNDLRRPSSKYYKEVAKEAAREVTYQQFMEQHNFYHQITRGMRGSEDMMQEIRGNLIEFINRLMKSFLHRIGFDDDREEYVLKGAHRAAKVLETKGAK